MTADIFAEWVRAHCKQTAATADTAAALIANRAVICDRWQATYAEICECTMRLAEHGVTPKFANEHLDALKAQLDQYRAERKAKAEAALQTVAGCDCPACNGGRVLPGYAAALARVRATIEGIGLTPPRRGR